MQKATAKASQTIAVLSRSFLQAKFTQAEWQAAFANDPNGELGLLVPVRVAECKPEGLLKARISIDLVGLDEQRARAKLLASISSKRRKPANAPQFRTPSVMKSEPDFPGHVVLKLTASSRYYDNLVSPSTASATNIKLHEHETARDPRLDHRRSDYWVSIPGGTFWMGAQKKARKKTNYDNDANDIDESPVHEVTLGAFRIARYPVTVGEYAQFIDDEGYLDLRWWCVERIGDYSLPEKWDWQIANPSRPVVGVSWFEASAFAAWASCRLPTEAEWERAARGTEGRKFPWGMDPLAKGLVNIANYDRRQPKPVGMFSGDATPDGIRDLAGNVLEWCADLYGYYTAERSTDPLGPAEGSSRVLRGGCWFDVAKGARSASRLGFDPSVRDDFSGFRLALSPLGQQAERPAR